MCVQLCKTDSGKQGGASKSLSLDAGDSEWKQSGSWFLNGRVASCHVLVKFFMPINSGSLPSIGVKSEGLASIHKASPPLFWTLQGPPAWNHTVIWESLQFIDPVVSAAVSTRACAMLCDTFCGVTPSRVQVHHLFPFPQRVPCCAGWQIKRQWERDALWSHNWSKLRIVLGNQN